jgi:hypothetical protein
MVYAIRLHFPEAIMIEHGVGLFAVRGAGIGPYTSGVKHRLISAVIIREGG